MKELQLVRKNITANEANKFEFEVEGFEFLVKNFTEGDIYVAYENTTDTSKMSKIPSMSGLVFLRNKSTGSTGSGNSSKEVYVYSDTSGEVEVQCLKF